MDRFLKHVVFLLMMAIVIVGCNKAIEHKIDDDDEPNGDEPSEIIDDNGDEIMNQINENKGNIKQLKDKIFILQEALYVDSGSYNIAREQFLVLINSDTTLQLLPNIWIGWVVLETKDGSPIPLATVEYFKASPLVASVSHPLEVEYNGVVQGLTNKFVAKLKKTTSYVQLQQLAAENRCTIGREEDYHVKNQFFVTVPKTSELNAMQMSDLFYETGLFESVQPTFVILNQAGINCKDKRILKVLTDEPAFVEKKCFEHVGRVDTFYLRLVNTHADFFSVAVFPLGEIPEQYREDGLSVSISGNVISCGVVGGCIEPYIRLAAVHLFELKSIKINN